MTSAFAHISDEASPPASPDYQLGLVTEVATRISRRARLSPELADEYVSWARARLIFGDYAQLRKFSGRSSFRSFLEVVLRRLLADFRNSEWGRWRPSAFAIRNGEAAVELERMVYRDQIPIRVAMEVIRARFPTQAHKLRALLWRWPAHWKRRHVSIDALRDADVSCTGVDLPCPAEAERVTRTLQAALAELDREDRDIVSLRFLDGKPVSVIARALRLDQKALYRRLDRILQRLRSKLAAAGVESEFVREVASRP